MGIASGERFKRTWNSQRVRVAIAHSGLQAGVAEGFLDGANVRATVQAMVHQSSDGLNGRSASALSLATFLQRFGRKQSQ